MKKTKKKKSKICCNHCYKLNKETLNFCTNCGSQLKQSLEVDKVTPQTLSVVRLKGSNHSPMCESKVSFFFKNWFINLFFLKKPSPLLISHFKYIIKIISLISELETNNIHFIKWEKGLLWMYFFLIRMDVSLLQTQALLR